MPWNNIFSAVNLIAMAAWIVLAFFPWRDRTIPLLREIVVLLLAATYTVLIFLLIFVLKPDGAGLDFSTLAGVQAGLSSDGGATIGWIHYLAFDLFVGLWIASDADARGFSRIWQVPILFFTFFLGPVGLTAWLLIRHFLGNSTDSHASAA